MVVLSATWLPANLTEVDPGGVDNLTFKLVELTGRSCEQAQSGEVVPPPVDELLVLERVGA